MIEDGLFDRFPCDAIFAMHNLPGFRPGQLLLREGATMASSENILVHIEGKGGHGAMPHQSADPVVAGSAIVMALQTIVSRNVPPLHMAVITVGSFQSGVVNNGLCCTSRKADEITPAPDAAMPWHPRAPCSGARVA